MTGFVAYIIRKAPGIALIMLIIALSGTQAAAQDQPCESRTFIRSYRIFFHQDKWDIDTAYQGNAATLRRMTAEIDSLLADSRIGIDSILIVSAASPDGGSAYNRLLSERRGETAVRVVRGLLPDFDPGKIARSPIGEDWTTLRQIVVSDENIPLREELLAIIDSNLSDDEKERRFRALRPTFRYIIRNHVHSMRASAVTIRILAPGMGIDRLDPIKDSLSQESGGLVQRGISNQTGQPFNRQIIFAFRSNLLVPALNIGMEVPIGDNWSMGLDYYYPWWLAKSNMYCAEMLGWFIDCKRWLGADRSYKDRLTGHAIGFYAGGGYYDYQWLENGAQGEYLDFGIDYTYSVPIAKDRLRMEFNIGFGWIGTQLRRYNPTEDYVDLIKEPGVQYRQYNFFGPTRASISLVLPIRAKIQGGGR